MTSAAVAPVGITTRSVVDQDWKGLAATGGIGAIILVFIALVGMPLALDSKMVIAGVLSLGYLSLLWVPFAVGVASASEVVLEGMEAPKRGARDLAGGVIVGLISGLGITLLMALIDSYNLRDPLVWWSDQNNEFLAFPGFSVSEGMVLWPFVGAGLGLLGAALAISPARIRKAVVAALLAVLSMAVLELAISDIFTTDSFLTRIIDLEFLDDFFYDKNGGLTTSGAVLTAVLAVGWSAGVSRQITKTRVRIAAKEPSEKRRTLLISYVLLAIFFMIMPLLFGKIMNELLANVGLFVLLALGLNIVVGLAGMVDLGYVAFFAVGGYTTAVLTSPNSPLFAPELPFGVTIVVVVIIAAITGMLIGAPVIRMRGDYLAIVTLGFGEIIRLLFLSDWLAPVFGGAQGITNIPGIEVGPFEIKGTDPRSVFYLVLAFTALAVYISWRLQNSRLGRSWMAIREDETVANAMGINTVNAKLLAFVVGAVLASFSGAIFAAKVGSIFPNSFLILVSVIILVIVIVGGMGSIPGVIVGAVVLIGVLGGPRQPGLLFELGSYKLLIYGALLVFMMLKRPEGLIPSAQRTRELHQEEFLQDAWLKGEIDPD
ncbi:MAG: branched-chain amino acid ABC transporter permease, partial [Acidimicrobiales bacterium]